MWIPGQYSCMIIGFLPPEGLAVSNLDPLQFGCLLCLSTVAGSNHHPLLPVIAYLVSLQATALMEYKVESSVTLLG